MKDYRTIIYAKINTFLDNHLTGLRYRKLTNTDFSIICNNCWGGYVYRRYGLPYLSPTIGLYFFADDFVRFCSDLKGYMAQPLEFISYTESKHKDIIESRKQTNIPLARLGDVEIVFLHYATQEEAADKWQRRKERINYDNLIFKFSKMNLCTDDHLKQFDELPIPKKFCFVPTEEDMHINCGILFRSAHSKESIANDTNEYARYIDIEKLINSEKVCGNHMEGVWQSR